LEDLEDQQQEWFPEGQGVVTDPVLARTIGFFNIYHQMWESIIASNLSVPECKLFLLLNICMKPIDNNKALST